LMRIVPEEEWIFFGPAMVLHGRYVCTFHHPNCDSCVMKDLCPKLGVGDEMDGADTSDEEDAPEDEEETPTMAAKKTKSAAGKKAARATKPAPAKAKPAAAAPAVPSLKEQLPPDWQAVLAAEFDKPYFKQLEKFVAQERASQTVYPPAEDMFNAFK